MAPSLHEASLPSSPAEPSSLRIERIERIEGIAVGALHEVDALVRDAEARGFVLVQASASVLDAVARHVERRARALGRPMVKVDGLPTDDAWRELASRLPPPAPGAGPVPLTDARAAARAVLERAGSSILLVREGAPTEFGRTFRAELAEAEVCQPLVIALSDEVGMARTFPSADEREGRVIDISGELSGDDLRLWWEAIARDPVQAPGAGLARLDALEAWWSAALATPPDERAPAVSLGLDAHRLLVRVALSQRSWAAAQIGRLGLSTAAAQELVRAGALTLDVSGRLVAGSVTLPSLDAEAEDARVVAEALDGLGDPWAAARASELFAVAGAFDQAEAAAARAVSAFADPAARADFWRRWGRTLAALPEVEALPRLLRSAELALRSGDVERSLELGGAALSRRPESFAALLALGRANVAKGDLSTARYWLGKAGAGTAQVEVELAEVCHMEGDFGAARRHALAAIEGAADAETRLHARNVVGKLLLAEAAWKEAEAHFAADACEAALAGDLTAELRARLNRAIALLSGGRLDEARAMLSSVLEEGERRGELRAVAYALTNLATIATLKREYLAALRTSERAFEARRRLGDRVALAMLITNLAELKLQLGMVSDAEQTLAFGRQACGPAVSADRASHFAYTAALIHLERGRTVEAGAELSVAIRHAPGSGHGARFGECLRLAAKIALEDGDLSAARSALAQAAVAVESPRERAWVAVLGAACARAAGEPFADAAEEALEKARAAGDPEALRDAHVLCHHAAAMDGDGVVARAHLDLAVSMRDQIAFSLPEDLRKHFLARRDLTELGRLLQAYSQASTGLEASNAPQVPAPSPSRPDATRPSSPPPAAPFPRPRLGAGEAPLPALRRMVGRTSGMTALSTAIRKVAQTDATVLVHGESGTGKELVAEAIHEASARRAGPIVKVNCAALVETLLLSELFGHEKGAFTGAAARRRGRFELAESGTLFLDEIGDISPRTQVALLRVLQDKTFERVGGVTPIRANVRIVCATHRDLAAMVARGDFREDLYYRLRGVVLEVPALRQRVADLPLIAAAILDRIASERGTSPRRLSQAALDALARHLWPGNVRELENALRAAALFAEGDLIELEDFTANVDGLRGLAEPPMSRPVHARGLRPGEPGCAPEPPGGSPVTLTSASVAAFAAAPAQIIEIAPESLSFDADGTDGALDPAAMTQPSKIAPLTSFSPSGGAPGSPTEVAYAAIRGGLSLSALKRDIERECIARALAETGGNITRAAGLLGMKRPRLSQLVKQYGFGAVDDGPKSHPDFEGARESGPGSTGPDGTGTEVEDDNDG